jgi:hypothetical protein
LGDVGVAGLRLLVGAALRNFLAGLVDDEAVGEDGFVGGGVEGDDARPERGLEPAAVLVAAFEVEVGGPLGAALAATERGGVGGTGVDPDVEGVAAAGEGGGGRPAGGQGDPGEDFGGGGAIPEIGAMTVANLSAMARATPASR